MCNERVTRISGRLTLRTKDQTLALLIKLWAGPGMLSNKSKPWLHSRLLLPETDKVSMELLSLIASGYGNKSLHFLCVRRTCGTSRVTLKTMEDHKHALLDLKINTLSDKNEHKSLDLRSMHCLQII